MRSVIRSAKFDPVVATKTYFRFDLNLTKTKFDDSVYNDEIVTEVVLCKNLLKDSAAKTYDDSPWIAHCARDSAANLRKRFNLSEDDLLKIAYNSDTAEVKQTSGLERYNYIYTDYYEIEDRVKGEIFYIVEGLKDIYGKKKKEYNFDSMFDFFQPNYVDGADECHSDLYFWRNQREDYNKMRGITNESAEMGTPKTILRGNWADHQVEELRSNAVKGIIHVKDPLSTVDSLKHAQIDPIVNQNLAMIQGEMQIIAKNIIANTSGDKTATEIKSNEFASQEIESEYREMLEEMMASIFFKWAKLAQKFYTTKRVIKLTGYTDAQFLGFKNDLKDIYVDDGKSKYLEFNNSALQGEFTVKIKAGSTLPDNQQKRVSNFTGFTGFLSNIPEAKPYINMDRIIEEAQEVFDVRNENLVLSKTDPYSENRLLSSGVWVTPQLTDDDEYHLGIHNADKNDSPEKQMHMFVHQRQMMLKKESQNLPAGQPAAMAPQQDPMASQLLKNMSPLPTQSGDAINPQAEALPPMQ